MTNQCSWGRVWVVVALIGLLVINACSPGYAYQSDPEDTPAPTNTLTPTITVVWFPATATLTPFPTPQVSPTTNLRPSLGEIIVRDDFSDEGLWSIGRTTTTSAAFGVNELTLAIAEPRAYVFSIREAPILSDFYVEIIASPTLCQGTDEYGMLIRYNSPQDFYRFSLSCDGQVRLDRLFSGKASSPQPWMASGAVPPGAPSSSHLAIWSKGKEMRFFVNDQHQFTVQDPMLPSGLLGVFARSAGDNAVTVSFTDLLVREITQ